MRHGIKIQRTIALKIFHMTVYTIQPYQQLAHGVHHQCYAPSEASSLLPEWNKKTFKKTKQYSHDNTRYPIIGTRWAMLVNTVNTENRKNNHRLQIKWDVTETKNSKCTLYILTKEPRKAPNWKFSLLYKREGSRDGLENICLNAEGTLRQHWIR